MFTLSRLVTGFIEIHIKLCSKVVCEGENEISLKLFTFESSGGSREVMVVASSCLLGVLCCF